MAAANINRQQFEELIKGDKPVLVDFWAPWCGYCRRIGPAFDAVAEQYADSLISVKINIDDEAQLSDEEQIEVIPTLVLYRNGEPVDSIVVPSSKPMIEDFLRRALGD